jgi:hypothetical protein
MNFRLPYSNIGITGVKVCAFAHQYCIHIPAFSTNIADSGSSDAERVDKRLILIKENIYL